MDTTVRKQRDWLQAERDKRIYLMSNVQRMEGIIAAHFWIAEHISGGWRLDIFGRKYRNGRFRRFLLLSETTTGSDSCLAELLAKHEAQLKLEILSNSGNIR